MKFLKKTAVFLVSFLALTSTVFASQASEGAATTSIPTAWWIAPLASVVALVIAYIFYKKVISTPEGNEQMIAIASHAMREAGGLLEVSLKDVNLESETRIGD
ncbi:unnamed protein product [marine sediment metagenome]|uniref:Uncharacterized protein n=1 Tax=marine sediment metagenome TaxID=412755 RepID=X1LX54_9ZZZZ